MRSRRLVGGLTLLALLAIVVGVSGFELPLSGLGGSTSASERLLPGVRAVAGATLVRVGAGAPAPGELAFLTVEPAGNLVVSDAQRHTVMRFDPSGHLLSEWGPAVGSLVIDEAAGVAVQGDNFFVVDRGQPPRILRLDTLGRLQATFSLESYGVYGLNGVAIDPQGNVYVADTGRNRILVLSATGVLLRQIGRGGTDLGGLTQPMMLAFGPDSGFFVADWENSRIEHWNTAFEATDAWPTGFRPFGVATDGLGRVFVPDTNKRRVVVYAARGVVLGELGAGSPSIDVAPKQVAVAPGNQLSVYVLGSDGIQRLDLENTAPPPQGSADVDVFSLLVIALLGAVLAFAFLSRRGRRRAALLGPPLDRPVRLDAKDRAERQNQQPAANERLLIAHQAKGEHKPAE